MTEKRILITEVSGECRHLRINVDPFDNDPGTYCASNTRGQWEKIKPEECKNCKREKRLVGISRAEAVERMAKALHSFDTIPTTEEQWRKEVIDNVKSLYRYRAEAVLDALLGGDND